MDRQAHHDLGTADGHDRHVPSEEKDFLSAGHVGVYEWAVERLVRPGTTFLDLGCGTGYGAARVTAAGASYDGADTSVSAIEFARQRYAAPGARFFVADLMEPLPAELAPRSYDVVFSSEVLEHVVDPFAFVEVMAAYMRDDGVGFVGTPNRLWSRDNMPDGALLARSHVMEFTPSALEALLRRVFGEVTVLYRVFPDEAIRSTVIPPGRPKLARGVLAFAREVAPDGLERARTLAGRRGHGRHWSPEDIVWLGADDARLDPARCVGLAAVCRAPTR
jgi:2-polyprenyl-3-methyl-5-hydroxy-6-metoxy-1,4-benzoquinol methylase